METRRGQPEGNAPPVTFIKMSVLYHGKERHQIHYDLRNVTSVNDPEKNAMFLETELFPP